MRGRRFCTPFGLALLATLTAGGLSPSAAHHEASPTVMDFTPPRAGTYTLHPIMRAPDGDVLGVDGRRRPLSSVTTGKLTVLGFVYTSCSDAHGCPLAFQVFQQMRRAIDETPGLRERVRLVTLSFDPAHDTPRVMRRYAGHVPDGGVEWTFLTTRSTREILPLLEGFGQDVQVDAAAPRGARRTLAHVLKVFLIDSHGMVREIYTSAYLYPAVILNDLETLRQESAGTGPSP